MASAGVYLGPDVFATVALLQLVDKLGVKVFEYEPETIEEYAKSLNPQITNPVLMRIEAAIGLFTSNLFWQDPVIFGVVCRAFNRRNKPESGVPDLSDIAWGMTEADLLMGEGDEDELEGTPDFYSMAVDKYAKYMLQLSGIYDTPESMKGITSPDIKTTFDDSEQMASIQERSDELRATVDLQVQDKMKELLEQLSKIDIEFSQQARKELYKLLHPEEKRDNNGAVGKTE